MHCKSLMRRHNHRKAHNNVSKNACVNIRLDKLKVRRMEQFKGSFQTLSSSQSIFFVGLQKKFVSAKSLGDDQGFSVRGLQLRNNRSRMLSGIFPKPRQVHFSFGTLDCILMYNRKYKSMQGFRIEIVTCLSRFNPKLPGNIFIVSEIGWTARSMFHLQKTTTIQMLINLNLM